MNLETVLLALAVGAVAAVGLTPLLLVLRHYRREQIKERIRKRIEEADRAVPRDSREYPWSDYKGRV